MTNRLALLLVLVAAAACTQHVLPGTNIQDTPEKRAIYSAIDAYVKAVNARDAGAVLAHVAPDYFDDAGTPEPNDDLDRAGLEKALAETFSPLDAEKLAVAIRRIEVSEDGTAFAEVFFDGRTVTLLGHRTRFVGLLAGILQRLGETARAGDLLERLGS